MKGITSRPFGTTRGGEAVWEFILTNDSGASVSVLGYGCTIHAIRVPDRSGALRDVCLGYATLAEYEDNGGYLGATVGRCANRIGGASFSLGSKEYPLCKNDGKNHLHGGARGFDKYVWPHVVKGDRLIFTRTSPDMEEGYPGTLVLSVAFSFSNDGILQIEYDAKTDKDTVINLTNHTYFNLEGDASGDVRGHVLQLDASAYTPSDAELIPTGEIRPVADTPLDFRAAKPIGQDIDAANGYDHNFVLDGSGMRKAAVLEAPSSGVVMTVRTDQPGIQIYTGGGLSGAQVSKTGAPYAPYSGVCLETQVFPDAIHHGRFPTPILCAGEKYHTATAFQFSVR